MALTTQTISEEAKVAEVSDGYEFIQDEKGNLSLKKIRTAVKKAVKESKEAVEAISDVVEEVSHVITKHKKKKR